MTLAEQLNRPPAEDKLSRFENELQQYGTEMTPEVIAEAVSLSVEGRDVRVVEAHDPNPDDERRKLAREQIEIFEEMDPKIAHAEMYGENRPSLGAWYEAALGTGLGIYPLYHAKHARILGEGIDTNIFTEPLFTDENGQKISAIEVVARKDGESEAASSLKIHEDIINYEIDDESRIIFSGSEDAVGIRVRSQLAKEMALRAVEDHDKSKPLVLASLGAGSAIPAIESMLYLQENGYEIGAYHFVDMDPMALATAMSLVRAYGIDESKIKLHIEDIMKNKLESIAAGSVDVVDAWGLAEYFPGRLGVKLAGVAHQLLADNGTYVYGNMLSERLQKEYFSKVVAWRPKVRARSMAESMNILDSAGFKDVYTGLPSENGVYAGYAGRKSPEGLHEYLLRTSKNGKIIVDLASR